MQGEENLRRKRQAYKRSQTLATLPVQSVRSSTESRDEGNKHHSWLVNVPSRSARPLLLYRASIPGEGPDATGARRSLSGGNVSEMGAVRTHTRSHTVRYATNPIEHPNQNDLGASFHTESSIGGGGFGRRHGSSSSSSSCARTNGLGGVPHAKRLGRTPSSPSVLLSKVKERIREKVFETSAEWPHMAAIVQERRQRAADAFEARMSLRRMRLASGQNGNSSGGDQEVDEILHQPQLQHRTRRVRIRSDPASAHRRTSSSGSCSSYGGNIGAGVSSSFDKDGARVAFRRRSISDDTYNQQSHQRTTAIGGIICSDDDLRAIVYEHRLRRSPVPLKNQETVSATMDVGDDVTADSAVFTDSLSNIPNVGFQGTAISVSSSPSSLQQDKTLTAATTTAGQLFSYTASNTHQDVVLDHKGKNAFLFMSCGQSSERRQKCPDTEEFGQEDTDKANTVVPDVVFDEHGQTWDVYGAEFDPEILGQAIQSHLEKIMKRRLREKGDCNECKSDTEKLEQQKIYVKNMAYSTAEAREENERALGFFLRYICFLARRQENATQNS